MQVNYSNQFPETAILPAKEIGKKTAHNVSAKPADSSTEESFKTDKLQHLKNVLADQDIFLKFRRDEQTGRLIVELISTETGDAIRQIPSEVSLKLSEAFTKIQGQFVDKQV